MPHTFIDHIYNGRAAGCISLGHRIKTCAAILQLNYFQRTRQIRVNAKFSDFLQPRVYGRQCSSREQSKFVRRPKSRKKNHVQIAKKPTGSLATLTQRTLKMWRRSGRHFRSFSHSCLARGLPKDLLKAAENRRRWPQRRHFFSA